MDWRRWQLRKRKMNNWNRRKSAPGKKPDKEAYVKAMELLSFKPRTEQELCARLLESGYTQAEAEEGISYVRSFGYINDRDYAQQYVSVRGAQKSRNALRRELKEKGIEEDLIEEALADIEEEEEDVLLSLLCKKAGEPHELDEKEYRRLFGFCARRGFSSGKIHTALHRYQDGEM